jgi:hypothetical protein
MKRFQILWMFLLLIGCAPSEVNFPTSVPETLEPTLVPTSTITSTPIPSPTAIPFTTTPVITPVPTWLPKEQEAYLLDLIETNNHCALPCLFGIQPGISTWEEIRKVEAPLYFRKAYIPDSQDLLDFQSHVKDKTPYLEIAFSGSGQFIENMIAAEYIFLPDDPRYSPAMAKAAQAYFLSNILAQYGMPSRILIKSQREFESESGNQAELLLLYDHLGFGIHYFYTNIVRQDQKDPILHTCPRDDHLERFRLYLQAPDDRTPLEKMTTTPVGGSFFPYSSLQPLEDMTALHIEDFYRSFKSAKTKACLDVRKDNKNVSLILSHWER